MTLRPALEVRDPAGSSAAQRRLAWIAASMLAVLATYVVAVVAGSPRALRACSSSKQDVARATAKKAAYEAYPSWRRAHPDQTCPRTIDELLPWMNLKTLVDPWGSRYVLACTDFEILIASPGPDGALHSADDIWSYD